MLEFSLNSRKNTRDALQKEKDSYESRLLRQHRIIADEDRRRTVAEQKSHSTSAYPL